jgi:hypothetical protein
LTSSKGVFFDFPELAGKTTGFKSLAASGNFLAFSHVTVFQPLPQPIHPGRIIIKQKEQNRTKNRL